MPTYSYACTECGDRFDVVQAFTDDALTTCTRCSGRLRKLFNSVGVVFKGSGFYRTDSRESAKSAGNGSANGEKTATNGADKGSTKSESSGSSESSSSSDKPSASSTSSSTTSAATSS